MAIINATYPRFQVIDANGNPLVGGKVYVYEAGTTTALDNWTDADKTAQNTQPVILDSTGAADIWFEQSAKIDVTTSDDVQVEGFPVDDLLSNITGVVTGNFNLVQNGSFEIDSNGDDEPDNWTLAVETNGTIAIDNTDQAHGFNSLKFDGGGSGAGTATSAKFDVLESGVISVHFTYKASLATTTTAVLVNWYDSADSFISATTVHDDTGTNPTSFTKFTYLATAPATAVRATLELRGVPAGGAQLSADVWFDDVAVIGAYELVYTDETQTLTNKTLTSPTINSATIDSPVINTTVSGTANVARLVQATAQATTSGTTVDFTSIPSWARKITVVIENVSWSATDDLLIQIGDSGGVETTGYQSNGLSVVNGTPPNSAVLSSTIGFIASDLLGAANNLNGVITIVNVTGNVWVAAANTAVHNGSEMSVATGRKTLSATLDRVRITSQTASTFDAGQVNIIYEG